MPSYRSILTVTVLKTGHRPEDVESAARNAVRRTTVLESFQVDVVRGEPRVTVRFTGSDDVEARRVHADVVDAVGKVARVERDWPAVVAGGRSVPLGRRR
ncbi:FMN-dependent dehydrogenase [Actinomyces sp. ZJ308]|uniref:FMN-dependent dehydrogenase n=1 Tax=Actinomyces sp. ZJ308 TaxID=2708342 RepID=UPI00141EB0A4|nr:FMN-dependent dehydrogenase [Actinomyces sp. ZJ308]